MVRNTVIMVRGQMIFLHNRCKKEEGTKVRKPGGLSIILAPTVPLALKEAGSNPPITTTLDSRFVGRFVWIKMSFPKKIKWGKRVCGFLNVFVASIYHIFDNKEHG